MVKVPSTMVPLGTAAPQFSLPDPATGRTISLDDFADAPALLVVFLSNHCPFVKHIAEGLARFGREYNARGLAIVGICANDVSTHPDDSPEMMAREVTRRGYTFPYLWDESQEVATAYGAACTPDFFLYDRQRELAYRGQFAAPGPSRAAPDWGADRRAACVAVRAGHPAASAQVPSFGCKITWTPGNSQ
jgi:peroxiredoxin